MKESRFRIMALAAVLTLTAGVTACSDDNKDENPNDSKPGAFFISVTGESAEYIMHAESIDEGELVIGNNEGELDMSGYTWIFNSDPSVAIGLIYNQGDPGVGLGYGVNSAGNLQRLGTFQISSRFTSYGFFGDYAVTSVGGQTPVDTSGNTLLLDDGTERADGVTFNFIDLNTLSLQEKYMTTLGITGTDDQATLSGIVDLGDGTFMTGLVCSQARDDSATGGSSSGAITYPDSVWVAVFDTDLNVRKIYRDNRISYTSGRYRSQYYSQIAKAGDGTIYVFSGSYDYNANATSRNCGALRIKSGAEDFDQDYYFDIETLSQGYRFRKLWHITGNYFLLEFYNHKGRLTGIDDPATQYAVVDVSNKTLKWVGGDFPSKDAITSTGTPMTFKGKMYFPLTAEGTDPAVYIIDPATGNAKKGVSIKGAATIRAVGRLIE